jgi:hypothetical protein
MIADVSMSFYKDNRRPHVIIQDELEDGHLGLSEVTKPRGNSFMSPVFSAKDRVEEPFEQLHSAHSRFMRKHGHAQEVAQLVAQPERVHQQPCVQHKPMRAAPARAYAFGTLVHSRVSERTKYGVRSAAFPPSPPPQHIGKLACLSPSCSDGGLRTTASICAPAARPLRRDLNLSECRMARYSHSDHPPRALSSDPS